MKTAISLKVLKAYQQFLGHQRTVAQAGRMAEASKDFTDEETRHLLFLVSVNADSCDVAHAIMEAERNVGQETEVKI